MNPIEDKLIQYYDLCEDAKAVGPEKSLQPILYLETVDGKKQINIKDKSELTFIEKVLAYFGFGPASLHSVTGFLKTRKFSELSSGDPKIFKCFQTINEKA